jgi:hypothetical protein
MQELASVTGTACILTIYGLYNVMEMTLILQLFEPCLRVATNTAMRLL